MKNILITLLVLYPFNTLFADTNIPEEINNVVTQIEEDLQDNGHRYIESIIRSIDEEKLMHYTAKEQNSNYLQPLSNDTIDDLFLCLNTNNCDIYLVRTNSDEQGGYVLQATFVLFESETNVTAMINHLVDTE